MQPYVAGLEFGVIWVGETPRGPSPAAAQVMGESILIRARASLENLLSGERSRWALWLPVWFGAGITAYFMLPYEPAMWAGAAVLSAALVVAALTRRHMGLHIAAWCAVVLAGGMTLAQVRTYWVAAPVLENRLSGAWVEGRVLRAQQRPDGQRIWLDRLRISRLAPAATPETIRLRIGRSGPQLRPGDSVSLRAVLYPPPGPAAPGAFDFARRAYFERLGGVGYAVSKVHRGARAEGSPAIVIAGLRHRITERVRSALPGPSGAVAAALMTGERGES